MINTIRAKVKKDPKWASRAIVALFEKQTATEQMIEATSEHNGVGFNAIDAEILSSFAKQLIAGRTLSEKQLAIAFKKLPKYAKQLAMIAEEKNPEPEAKNDETYPDGSDLVFEYEGRLFADASQISGKFGEMVWTIAVKDELYTYNGERQNDKFGELVAFVFRNENGDRLTVFND